MPRINLFYLIYHKFLVEGQLAGGKHFAPNNETRSDLQNCPTTNIMSETDFAWYDQKRTQTPTLSDIAVSGIILFNNSKSGNRLDKKSISELKTLLKLPDTTRMVGLKNKRIEKKIFCHTKLTRWKRLYLKKRLNCKNSMIKKNI